MAVAAAAAAQSKGAPPFAPEIRGAVAVAEIFRGRARAARPALVDGDAGAAFAPGGAPQAVFSFVIADGKIVELEVVGDPARLAEREVRLS